MCALLVNKWGGVSNIVFENPPSRFFFFLPKLSSLPLPLQAAEIEELSYVKKHLDVHDSKMILMFMTRKCLFLSFVWTHTQFLQ